MNTENNNQPATGHSPLATNNFFRASAADFKKIPGSPIAYWVSEKFRNIFSSCGQLNESYQPKAGTTTTHNDRFLRYWYEVPIININYNCISLDDSKISGKKWFPYNKGGGFRKYYGNNDYLMNWENDGEELKDWIENHPVDPSSWSRYIRSVDCYFKSGVTWGDVSSAFPSFRWQKKGSIAGSRGPMIFTENMNGLIAYLNSNIIREILKILNPTLTFNVGNIASLPLATTELENSRIKKIVNYLINISKSDWDSYETSWDFEDLPLLDERMGYLAQKYALALEPDVELGVAEPNFGPLSDVYGSLYKRYSEITVEMKRLEEENNKIFIDAYGLEDELTPDVPIEEITLTCNPAYRYGRGKTEDEYEQLFRADTMREYISYAVGCMFGRYSLDIPGLALANQGETLDDYKRIINDYWRDKGASDDSDSCNIKFMPDDDNVIPVLDTEYFEDDIASRFKLFLRTTFEDEFYELNLKFIEDAIGKNIRNFFLKDFYNDHIKRYKKRPIYWMFSSPKKSFNCLIYMHRYTPDTPAKVLDYLRDYQSKLRARQENLQQLLISETVTPSERKKAEKENEKINASLQELGKWERDVIHPLALQKPVIELDDGVKVNYNKFPHALAKITGLTGKK